MLQLCILFHDKICAKFISNIYKLELSLLFMAQDKIQMPSSGGGLVRYFDDYESKFEIDKLIVIGVIVAVIVFELVLYKFF